MEFNNDLRIDKYEESGSRKLTKNVDSKKDFLKPRDYKIDFDSKVNTTQIIPRVNGKARFGQYCEICDYLATDSANYLDHINGKRHQRNLNMSMRIQRSTLQDVKTRFDANQLKKNGKYPQLSIQEIVNLLKRKEESKKNDENNENKENEEAININTIDIEEEEEKIRDKRRQDRKNGKKRKFEPIENEEPVDDDMANLMGFGGFGGSKKNN